MATKSSVFCGRIATSWPASFTDIFISRRLHRTKMACCTSAAHRPGPIWRVTPGLREGIADPLTPGGFNLVMLRDGRTFVRRYNLPRLTRSGLRSETRGPASGRLHHSRFPLQQRRCSARAAPPLPNVGRARPRRIGLGRQRCTHSARHHGQRRAVSAVQLRWRAVSTRAAPGRRKAFHHFARWHRPWPVEQAERWNADEFSRVTATWI